MNIKMDYTVIPGVSTNCYLLINKDTDEAVIIDPAGNEPQISALIEKNKINQVSQSINLSDNISAPISACQ